MHTHTRMHMLYRRVCVCARMSCDMYFHIHAYSVRVAVFQNGKPGSYKRTQPSFMDPAMPDLRHVNHVTKNCSANCALFDMFCVCLSSPARKYYIGVLRKHKFPRGCCSPNSAVHTMASLWRCQAFGVNRLRWT